jgi:hypothetical protein
MRRCALCGTSLDDQRQDARYELRLDEHRFRVEVAHGRASRAEQQRKRARRLIADVTERMRLAVRVGALPDAAPRAPEASALPARAPGQMAHPAVARDALNFLEVGAADQLPFLEPLDQDLFRTRFVHASRVADRAGRHVTRALTGDCSGRGRCNALIGDAKERRGREPSPAVALAPVQLHADLTILAQAVPRARQSASRTTRGVGGLLSRVIPRGGCSENLCHRPRGRLSRHAPLHA